MRSTAPRCSGYAQYRPRCSGYVQYRPAVFWKRYRVFTTLNFRLNKALQLRAVGLNFVFYILTKKKIIV